MNKREHYLFLDSQNIYFQEIDALHLPIIL